MKKYLVVIIIVILVGYILIRVLKIPSKPSPSPSVTVSITSSPTASSVANLTSTPNPSSLAFPVADFKARVTKKPFGIYITPQNSPVQPERFTGYHTGADAEYADVSTDVPVYALTDGSIIYSNWVSGYGGVLIIKINLDGKPHSVLYGHLRPTTLPAVGTNFKKGQQMAVLGTGYSHETDGERRHLHLGILSNDRIDLRGYVQTKSELSLWLDPLTFFK